MTSISFIAFSDEFEKIAKEGFSKGERAAIAASLPFQAAGIGNEIRHLVKGTHAGKAGNALLAIGPATLAAVGAHHALKKKEASVGHAAVDIAGLGVLAAPTIAKKMGKPMSEKNKDRAELGGLGMLAGGVAHEHRHDFLNAAKNGVKKLTTRVPKQLALL
jgi:hypothetical protein